MTEDLTTLDGLRDAAWARLERAVRDRSGPAHLLTLATVGEAGAEARLLVLRSADRAAGTVTLWTNRHSAKVAEIEASPRCTALFWDEAAGLQVRLRLEVSVQPGPPEVWDSLNAEARANYALAPAPGEPLPSPTDAGTATPDASAFVALVGTLSAMECLCLATTPHRRALFDASGARWLAP